MSGLEAIAANNGWAMALTGAIIVMCGLSILSLIISQLHKIISFFDKQTLPADGPADTRGQDVVQRSAEVDILKDLDAAARIFQSLTADETESFQLARLYALSEKAQLPHPHLTIRALRDANYLLPTGEGSFCWKKI